MTAPKKAKPKKKAKKVNKGGRPTVMTQATIDKLEEAFAIGCTDIEACLFANISDDVLYKYQREHPEYIKRKVALKETPVLKARTKVVTEIDNDTNTAKWYLERKNKDEFGNVQKIEGEIKTEHDISPALADMFNKMYKGDDQ